MDSSCANPGQGSRTSPSLRRHVANQSRSMGASRRLGASGRPGATSWRGGAMESPPPSWSPDVEPLDENVLSRVRALVADPPTRYFDERHDRPGSEHLERAVHVQLLRSLAAAPACEVTDRNHALALGMRQRLLGEGAASPGVADELNERLGAWCAAHWPARPLPELRLWRFEGTGRGLACRAALSAGEAALAVPEALLLTAAPTLAHPLG